MVDSVKEAQLADSSAKKDTFEAKVKLAVERAGSADRVYELILDGVKSQSVVGLSSAMTNLLYLSMNSTGLVSLDGIPELQSLQELEASDNRITGGLKVLGVKCPKITRLNLSGNRIRSLSELEPLKDLELLMALDLFKCPVSEDPEFRKAVFDMIPSLQLLDGRNSANEECDLSDEEDDDDDDEGDSEEEDNVVVVPDSDEDDDDVLAVLDDEKVISSKLKRKPTDGNEKKDNKRTHVEDDDDDDDEDDDEDDFPEDDDEDEDDEDDDEQ